MQSWSQVNQLVGLLQLVVGLVMHLKLLESVEAELKKTVVGVSLGSAGLILGG